MKITKSEPLLEISGDSGAFTDYYRLESAFRVFVETLSYQRNVWVSLMFCSPQQMQSINEKYRGDNKTTDVLSFPSELISGNPHHEVTEMQYLGEILIDINYIVRQTESVILSNAVLQVFIHGLLHLAGFDHLNTQQKDKMQEMENSIMKITIQDSNSGR